MSDPRDDYRDAMQQYETARAAASKAIKLVKAVSEGLSYNFPTFLTATFGLVSAGSDRNKVHQLRLDMTSWPTGEEFIKVLTAWHKGFERVHIVWGQIPLADRTVAKPPPEQMTAG